MNVNMCLAHAVARIRVAPKQIIYNESEVEVAEYDVALKSISKWLGSGGTLKGATGSLS